MASWAYGSNNVRGLALQEAARTEFGLTNVQLDPATQAAEGLEPDYNRGALQEFLRTQYEMGQEVLGRPRHHRTPLLPGVDLAGAAPQPEWAGLSVGDSFMARHRPLTSWSADRQIVADWLEQRGGRAMKLIDSKPARDIFSLPTTGMGFFGQKEWATLPATGPTTLDGIYTAPTPAAGEQTAASSIHLGAPVLSNAAGAQAPPRTVSVPVDASARLQPLNDQGFLHSLAFSPGLAESATGLVSEGGDPSGQVGVV
ncbi:hypothetical protein [Streptomyces sp. CB01201]|uniref:hypothetical protein n=1 Tax=Streptomyces sp. CB01201 TaxID=2020324 RepID=UPI0018FE69FB|nr:hypothetical protein [Streptomyces sp. CB01201]